MKLSLSIRIAEAAEKRSISIPFDEFADLARQSGYHAVCMRASAAGVQTPTEQLQAMGGALRARNLSVSMITSDFDVPLNNERGSAALRDIGPHLNVAEALGATLLRVCMKKEEDIQWAQRAADAAAARGIRLAHQCHTTSLFETVDQCVDVLERIDRTNFGLIYEPANLMLCGQDYGPNVIRRLQRWIMNVYVQNHCPSKAGKQLIATWVRGAVRFDPIPLWEIGGVDFDQVFSGLADISYGGFVTVHQAYAELVGPREAAVKSRQFLRTLGRFEQ